MGRLKMKRSRVIALSAGGLLIVGVSVWLWVSWLTLPRPPQRPQFESFTPYEHATPGYNEAMDRLYNRIARKKQWEVEDAAYIVGLMETPREITWGELVAEHRGALNAFDPAVRPYVDAWLLAGCASSFAAEWLRFGMPIAPEARVMLERAIRAQLDDFDPTIRRGAISRIVNSGMVEDPGVRAEIEALLDDPDPKVAGSAAHHLRHHNRMKQSERRWRTFHTERRQKE